MSFYPRIHFLLPTFEIDKYLCNLYNSIHLPNSCCWKNLYTSSKNYFAHDLKIHYNSLQENREFQQTNLQAVFSTNQSIEHRENTNQNILVLFFSSSLSFFCITEFFFYSKLTSHKTRLSSFICPSITSLTCLTCP